jgi:hypothetical protein
MSSMQKHTPQPDDIKLSATVSRDVWERLKALATQQRRSLNDLLNEWIAEKLELPSKSEPQSDEGRKGGEGEYRPNLRSASALCDRPS